MVATVRRQTKVDFSLRSVSYFIEVYLYPIFIGARSEPLILSTEINFGTIIRYNSKNHTEN